MATAARSKARADVVIERLARSTPAPSARSCTTTRSSCSRRRSCRRRPPTRTSTRSRRSCSPAYPTPRDLAHADPDDVETIIHSTGFFRSKTKNLIGMARALDEDFDGEVPTELDDLVKLPGVGRKTGNVVRSVAFDLPGLPVDTHVGRLSRRLKLTTETDPVKAELDLNALVAPGERGRFIAAADPARPAGVLRPQPELRRVRAPRHLSVGGSHRQEGGSGGGTVDQVVRVSRPAISRRVRRRGGLR